MKITTLSTLEMIDAADDLLTAQLSNRDFRIFRELEASGYIVGQIGPSTHDAPATAVEDVGFSADGRLLLERLQREDKDRSFFRVAIRWATPLVIYFSGMLSPMLLEFIKTLLEKK